MFLCLKISNQNPAETEAFNEVTFPPGDGYKVALFFNFWLTLAFISYYECDVYFLVLVEDERRALGQLTIEHPSSWPSMTVGG
jgi:hypothetical protein